jgi:polyribonucleotide nucleotidyltransferase
MSSDKQNQSDAIACLAASAALAVSDIPFAGPVSEVRVARVNGKYLNPTFAERRCDLDLIVAGTKSDILMVEGEMKEVQEADMIEAIKVAHEAIQKQCIAMEELSAMVPKSQVKRTYNHENNDAAIGQKITTSATRSTTTLAMEPSSKEERMANFAPSRRPALPP